MLAIQTFFENLSGIGFAALYSDVLRYILPLLALLILWRCGRSLLTFRREPEVWAWLAAPSGEKIPVTHWESLVGRSASCDVVLDYPTISRRHAVLTRYDDGSWSVSDIGSKGGIRVNGADTDMCAVGFGWAAWTLRSFPSRRSRSAFRPPSAHAPARRSVRRCRCCFCRCFRCWRVCS